MEPNSDKFTLGGKHLKSRSITSSAREMQLSGNKSKVKTQILSLKSNKSYSNVTLEVTWKLTQVNTEQTSWKTTANCKRVDSISHSN